MTITFIFRKKWKWYYLNTSTNFRNNILMIMHLELFCILSDWASISCRSFAVLSKKFPSYCLVNFFILEFINISSPHVGPWLCFPLGLDTWFPTKLLRLPGSTTWRRKTNLGRSSQYNQLIAASCDDLLYPKKWMKYLIQNWIIDRGQMEKYTTFRI